MRVGTVFREFTAKDGLKVTLRTPIWRDLDDLLELINTAVAEQVDILIDRPQTREQEADWLGRVLARIEKGEAVYVVPEADGRVVGNSEVSRRAGCMNHTGDLGILLRREYRNRGIGTEMMRTLIDEARKMGLERLFLRHFAGNLRARHVYEKVGFKETGREPKAVKRAGNYEDVVIMALEL